MRGVCGIVGLCLHPNLTLRSKTKLGVHFAPKVATAKSALWEASFTRPHKAVGKTLTVAILNRARDLRLRVASVGESFRRCWDLTEGVVRVKALWPDAPVSEDALMPKGYLRTNEGLAKIHQRLVL